MESPGHKLSASPWFLAIAALLFFGVLSFATYKIFAAGIWKNSPASAPVPRYTLEDYRKEAAKLHSTYVKETEALYEEFLKEVKTSGAEEFLKAENNVEHVIQTFSGFKAVSRLVGLMAYDMVTSKNSAQAYISMHMGPAVIDPCAAGERAVQEKLNTFLHKLQEKNNAFHADLALKLAQLSREMEPGVFNASSDLRKSYSSISDLAQGKASLAVGVAFDVFAYKSILRGLKAILQKILAKLAASAAAAAADGPIPVGDIVAVAGFAWSIYDIYHVQMVLPGQLRTMLTTLIAECREKCRREASEKAAAAMKAAAAAAGKAMKQFN